MSFAQTQEGSSLVQSIQMHIRLASQKDLPHTMSSDPRYPFPQVFLVDNGGGAGSQPSPNLIPCWSSLPPRQERVSSRVKGQGCLGVSTSAAMLVLMLFLLVFASLGFEAWEIQKLKEQRKELEVHMLKEESKTVSDFSEPLKQIGEKMIVQEEKKESTSAHLTGRVQKIDASSKPLKWHSNIGRAYTSGGVAYRMEDGALQVNESGLYHIYCRLELIFKCTQDFGLKHSVFVRRAGQDPPLVLMEAHRTPICPQRGSSSWTTESYLASTHRLSEFDKVLVNVSHPAFLSHFSNANFFGLYKL